MPRPRPLTPDEAKRTLAARFGPRVDSLRQLNTRYGLRPYRVTLVWTKWTGSGRGAGKELPILEYEILPTPNVKSMDSVSFSIFHAGTVPVGSIRLTEVTLSLTFDELNGHAMPRTEECECDREAVREWEEKKRQPHADQIPQPFDFFYELREDGRGDHEPVRLKYRLLNVPMREPGKVQWSLMLEKIAEDRNRDGTSAYTTGRQGG
jgi:hypothetical protein